MNATETMTANVTFEDVLAVAGPPTGLLQLVATGWEDTHAFFSEDRHGRLDGVAQREGPAGLLAIPHDAAGERSLLALRMVMAERTLRLRRD